VAPPLCDGWPKPTTPKKTEPATSAGRMRSLGFNIWFRRDAVTKFRSKSSRINAGWNGSGRDYLRLFSRRNSKLFQSTSFASLTREESR
jgi:hypothetical protein